MMPFLRFEILKNHILSGDHTYLPYVRDYLLPPKATWQANTDPDLDDKCQVIHEFSVVKCCLCYLNIFKFKYMK